MNHASTYPCTWCESRTPFEIPGQLRTLGRIRDLARAYKDAGSPKNKASQYFNCIHEPLFDGDDSETLLEIIPPPELHLMLGTVGHLFSKINEMWGDNQGIDWALDHYIHLAPYRGGSLEGPQCKALLQDERLADLKLSVPENLEKFVEVLHQFNLVRESCFGQDLAFNYKSQIEQFEIAYKKLGISVTPKIHCIFVHVPQFCDLKGVGLGFYSEQASESVHYDFKQTWNNYKVKENHPDFAKNLLKAVLKYNALHI